MRKRPSWTEDDRFRRLTTEEIAGFDPDRRARLGALICAAMPEFCDLIPLEHDRVVALMASLLGAPGTDFANVHVLRRNREDLALLTELPASEFVVASKLRTLMILRALDRADRAAFMAAVDTYRLTVEPIPPEGLYGSSLAASPSARGMGLGRVAMKHFLDLAGGRTARLHVGAGNGLVIALHRKLGFEFASDEPYAFRAMVRQPGDASCAGGFDEA